MEHVLPELPYQKCDLLPSISSETLDYHHDKHHAAYVANLNKLIKGTEFENMKLEEIVQKSSGAIFNNAAQHWNHSFYWNSLSPKGGGEPMGPLGEAIKQFFGSYHNFQKVFTAAATGFFGSGWIWLIKNKDGSVELESTGNAATPLKEGKVCLLTCDLWEHAYYIDYKNVRAKYIEEFWKIVNWKFAQDNYKK